MCDQALEIQVWSFNLEQESFPDPAYTADSARGEKIADPLRLRFFRRSRHLLRSVLARRLRLSPGEVNLQIAAEGKPFVDGCQFSLSHSGPWLLIAVSDHEVGIDVECAERPRRSLALAERFFSAEDFHALRDLDESERDTLFLRQWVAKEAALKCDGSGLASHLDKAVCAVENGVICSVQWDAGNCAIHEFALPDGSRAATAWKTGLARFEWCDASKIGVS